VLLVRKSLDILSTCSRRAPRRRSLRNIILVPKDVKATILESCLSQSVDIFKELQFCEETVICRILHGNLEKIPHELDDDMLLLVTFDNILGDVSHLYNIILGGGFLFSVT
jgi:hypothetical protein